MTLPILGINCYAHDSAAAILVDGNILAAAEEERFTRRKHTGEFPVEAIRFCLKRAGLSFSEIRHIAYSADPYLQFKKRFFHGLRYLDRRLFSGGHGPTLFSPFFLKGKLQSAFKQKANFKLHYINHHRAHAASVFYTSPFEKAALLSIDGSGEWATTFLGKGEDNRIQKLQETFYPHSLGLFYGTLTQYLGFRPNYDEGKIMALAGYGEPDFKEEFRRLISSDAQGGFRLDLKYFDFYFGASRWYSKEMEKLLGPARIPGSPLEKRHHGIAATLQWMTEEILLSLVRSLHEKTGLPDLCLAGGVALNCSANGMLLRRSPFKRIFVQPACGDAGTSVGAALVVYHDLLGGPRQKAMNLSAYLGPDYDETEMESSLKKSSLQYVRVEKLEERVAAEIAKGGTVGWFQGRMEFGPRALGARSILADPRTAGKRDYLNREIKHREPFRPFGPAVLEEHAHHFFDIPQASPFMLFAASVHSDKVSQIGAVVHEDLSSRIQTVGREGGPPRYRGLLEAYERLTGIPLLLNTSFNMKDEPIVCSPQDAVSAFTRSKLDFLAMGPYLAWKT